MEKRRLFNLNNFDLINILGLSIGITCVFAIMLWVDDELKFDTFHNNADKIYRVIVKENNMDGYTNSAMTPRPLAKALKEKLPEIEKATSFEMDWEVVTNVENNYFKESNLAVVGEDFFDIFSFPFIKGSPELLLNDKYSIVISEKIAQKYFGKTEVIGKHFSIDEKDVTVVGVFKEMDYNSHIRFDIAISLPLGHDIFHSDQSWNSQNLFTYIKIAQNAVYEDLSSNILKFIPDYINPKYNTNLLLQPLSEIHFQKGLADEDYTYLGNKIYVYIFSFMGLFILILACVNYINLSTAISEKCIKENSMRKVLGASKIKLMKNSLLRSLYISFLATGIALGILLLLLPFINAFTLKNLHFDLTKPLYILFLLVIPLLTGFLSGFYPSLYIASFSPLNLTKNIKSSHVHWYRNALVVFQFSLSICLIIATLISHKQLDYIRNIDTGFTKEQTIYFYLSIDKSGYKTLKENLLKIPGVDMVAGKNYFSSTIINTTTVRWHGNEEGISISMNFVNEDFFPLLNVPFVTGHNFSKDFKSELTNGIIINKKANEIIGENNLIGMYLRTLGKSYKVIGVIDNVHFRSVNETLQPEFYVYTSDPRYFFVRFNNNLSVSSYHIISQIKSVIKELFPDKPFEFEFLDNTYAKLYDNDKRIGTIFGIVALIAIFISCIGLFGLSSYYTENRTKEIGVRKINGARISNILALLNIDFIKWVVIAFSIATPVAYIILQKWLENFAHKTNMSWWIFVLAGTLALGIALLTVSWQSWRAARRNPVEALRYE